MRAVCPSRRKAIKTLGAGMTVSIAGCLGGGGNGENVSSTVENAVSVSDNGVVTVDVKSLFENPGSVRVPAPTRIRTPVADKRLLGIYKGERGNPISKNGNVVAYFPYKSFQLDDTIYNGLMVPRGSDSFDRVTAFVDDAFMNFSDDEIRLLSYSTKPEVITTVNFSEVTDGVFAATVDVSNITRNVIGYFNPDDMRDELNYNKVKLAMELQ